MGKLIAIACFSIIGILPAASGQSKDADRADNSSKATRKAEGLPVGKPGPGMVWVDAKTKIYYHRDHPLYGKTKKGAYMSEGDAVNSGFHDSTEKAPAKSK
jgi:hypothetical protein